MPTKAFLLATVLLAACQATTSATDSSAPQVASPVTSSTNPAGGGSEKLYAHRWALTEAAGQPVVSAGDAQEAHLLFSLPNRLSGSTGCNRLMGTFELLDGGQMKFSPLATTRMMCQEPAATTETRFVKTLGTVQSYYVTDSLLELRAGATVVARFRATIASPGN